MCNDDNKKNNNIMKPIIVTIVIFTVLTICLPLLLEYCIFRNNAYSPVTNGEWASFWGSFLGGLIGGGGTLVAVFFSINATRSIQAEQTKIQKKQMELQEDLLIKSVEPILQIDYRKYGGKVKTDNMQKQYIEIVLNADSSTQIFLKNVGSGNMTKLTFYKAYENFKLFEGLYFLQNGEEYKLSLVNIAKSEFDETIEFNYMDIYGTKYQDTINIKRIKNALHIYSLVKIK